MAIIDSHCHTSDRWGEPVETLLFQMDRIGIERAVLVQLLGQYDNSYQQACMERHPGRFASVVAVDPADVRACLQLRDLAAQGASGLRLRPGARSLGADPLELWRCAESLGLAVSCVGSAEAFCDPSFAELVAELPRLQIVLEHLGSTSSPDANDAARAARSAVFELARFPNVALKVPGIGELVPRAPGWASAHSPFVAETPQTLEAAVKRFGAGRLMWGSDFPPVASREGYAIALRGCQEACAELPAGDRVALFGGTAQRVFFPHAPA